MDGWTPEQERWRGGVDADLRAVHNRVTESAQARESKFQDHARWIADVNGEVKKVEREAEVRAADLAKKIEDIHAQLIDRIAKAEGKLITTFAVLMTILGGVLALVQYLTQRGLQ